MIKARDTNANQIFNDYLQSYNIYKGIKNMKSIWEEVASYCFNGVWHKFLPGFIEGYIVEELDNINHNDDIFSLTYDCRFKDVTIKDFTEFVDMHQQPLLNQEVDELLKVLDLANSKKS